MDMISVIAALVSAALHAGWNAAVKASPRPTAAMAAQIILSAVLVVPVLAFTGLPPIAAWPWIVASSTAGLLTVSALLRGYETGGFGVVYPVARAIAVLLVVPMSIWLAGDRLSGGALAGIAAIVAALGLLALEARKAKDFPVAALLWTITAGITTAIYVLADARGVRASGSALQYGAVVSVINGFGISWRQRKLGTPWQLVRENAWVAAPASCASIASYFLILWVFSFAPIAPSAALRDTSAVFALLIAIGFLGEPFTRLRVLAVLLAAAAVPLLRLG